jgi:hypothetical protein
MSRELQMFLRPMRLVALVRRILKQKTDLKAPVIQSH